MNHNVDEFLRLAYPLLINAKERIDRTRDDNLYSILNSLVVYLQRRWGMIDEKEEPPIKAVRSGRRL